MALRRIPGILGRLALLALILSIASTAQQSAEQLYKDATSAYDRGEFTRAISLYERVVKLQPDSVAARSDLGVALVHEGRYAEGIAQYQEALKRDPENLAVKLDLALAWYKSGDFDKSSRRIGKLFTLLRTAIFGWGRTHR
jgi:tetratricopeptide (TPR) repeat protein